MWETCHRLTDAALRWWDDLDAVVYRARTTPATSTNVAFFSQDAFTDASWPLADRPDVLADLVLRHGFTLRRDPAVDARPGDTLGRVDDLTPQSRAAADAIARMSAAFQDQTQVSALRVDAVTAAVAIGWTLRFLRTAEAVAELHPLGLSDTVAPLVRPKPMREHEGSSRGVAARLTGEPPWPRTQRC